MTPVDVIVWNHRHPVGTAVGFAHDDGHVIRTYTAGLVTLRDGVAVVAVDGLGEVELARCVPCAPYSPSLECDGRTCACVRRFALRVCPGCLEAGCGEDSNTTPCRLAKKPALAAPAAIVLMQLAPGAWTVELTVAGVRRFVSAGLRSRRRAMETVTEWLEMDGGSR